MKRSFNLVTEPWLEAFDVKTMKQETVSLEGLFANAARYRLAGDMATQDFAMLRLLLAILHTALDTHRMSYEDWRDIYEGKVFPEAVNDYLSANIDRFDFFGERPFYQVTAAEYDKLVPAKKRIESGSGKVAVRQIDRTISESGNSVDLFSPRSKEHKDELPLPSLIRWIITYQGYSGTTDKTKITMDEKFAANMGWLYQIKPTFIEGENLFETLMLNLVLGDAGEETPVWSYDTASAYIKQRRKREVPDNLAALYTTGTRILHIEWGNDGKPTIFSASIPMFGSLNALIEPMTFWRYSKRFNAMVPKIQTKETLNRPLILSLDEALIGKADTEVPSPGVIQNLQKIYELGVLKGKTVQLTTMALVSDGNVMSRRPVAEYRDDITLDPAVAFDEEGQKMVCEAAKVARYAVVKYRTFIANVAKVRNTNSQALAGEADKAGIVAKAVLSSWLAGVSPDDDYEADFNGLKKELTDSIKELAEEFCRHASARDITGREIDGKRVSIFTARRELYKDLAQTSAR
ncbi:type I-E CRISPR-associated protein Cse1/CasA [Lactiplantibacillus modestisalitolerans]|uniref:Type I-E CRISPR-associated protein Cse1/CasA n=1 Tax=Lactiplantibacillus modestisalitolerans TaxID=1457219 RepID=A0ABV5WX51_9LACO|nr:type I-E CRISPR-associated protein Cse1/CasA [Lactiplantibacillus modestisalitolerans]